MKSQNILIAHPTSENELDTIKAFFNALKIKFEVSNENPYDPDFVDKIVESRKEAQGGKTIKIALDDIWK